MGHKIILDFIWKFRTLFLLLVLIGTLYFGFKYVTHIKEELKDTKEVAEIAIKEHDKMINNYTEVNVELDNNQKQKQKLELTNKELRRKLEIALGGKNEAWSNTIIPDSVRVLLEQ